MGAGARRAGTLAPLLGSLALLAAGCGGEAQGDVGAEFVRADRSIARFPETVRAWCGPFDDANEDVEAVHVLAGELPGGAEEPAPFWIVSAVRADLERSEELTLPHDFPYTEPRGAAMFALDDAAHRHNELSSASERSAGTLRVELSGCEPGDTVEVGFDDLTLGSEFHDAPSLSVDGAVAARIGEPPPGARG